MSQSRDNLFSKPHAMLVDFAFDEQVARVFPDMIRRSVPGYETVIALLGVFAQRYVQAQSQVYDLGCSLGAATLAIRHHIQQPDCRIIAVDNAQAMVSQCRQHIESDQAATPVEVILGDITEMVIENASLVVINFTLQFIPTEQRLVLLEKIYQGLNSGGALVITDKIMAEQDSTQSLYEDLHMTFKKLNGYSDLEISQKRSALENVLVPDSLATHQQRLKQVGFKQVETWFQCFNFAGVCAVKASS